MQRITTNDSQFHDGNPLQGTLGTIVTAAWLTAVQEEIALALEAFGVVLNPADNTQLKTLLQLIGDAERATFTGTATGMTTSPTGSIEFYRNRGMVGVTFPVISGVSNAVTFTLTGMPSTIRPLSTRICYVRVTDSGTGATVVEGIASISSAGVISLYRGPDGGVWTNGGTKSIQICTVIYYI